VTLLTSVYLCRVIGRSFAALIVKTAPSRMHRRVTAWVWASCAAPAALIVCMVTAGIAKQGHVQLVGLFWLALVAFLILASSLALFSPILLLPLERRKLSSRFKAALTAAALIIGASFTTSLLIGPLALSILLGALLDAVVFLLILQRPNNTVERVGPPGPRPS